MPPWSGDVVVLGAGPAGVMAAHTLAALGRTVAVVDRAPAVGGMAASLEVSGQRVDLGSHRLHRSIEPALLAELQRLLGTRLQARPRGGRVRLAGRWLGYPMRPLDLLRHAPVRLSAGFVGDMITAPLRSPRGDTFAELVRCGPGPTLLREFYAPYARKLWAAEPELLSGELFRRRVSAASTAAIVRRVVRRRPKDEVGFWYPDTGFGAITETLAQDAVDHGATLALWSPVDSIRRSAGIWEIHTPRQEFRAPTLISTIPNVALAQAADAPDHVATAAAALRHRAAVLVYLVHDRPRYTPFDAHYFPGPEVSSARLSEPKNYRDGRDPADRTVLCAELPASVDDSRWQALDDDLVALVADDLARCGLPPVELAGARVVRLPHVYPVYDLEYAARQAVVETWASTQPGLILVGRQALFAHDNTHHALEMGHAAAHHAASGGSSVDWSRRREHFRAHVVED